MPPKTVYLAFPAYGGVDPEMMLAAIEVCANRQGLRIKARTQALSLLAHNFNMLWCEALNRRREWELTHFAMIHGDVAPQNGWLKILIDEMERVGADVLSACVPIKDGRGLVSTAVEDLETDEITKLSLGDLAELPETFDSSDLGPHKRLLGNTGLWVCDFTKPWVEQVWFEIIDRIERRPDGTFEARVLPEDWNFSQKVLDLGGKVFATQILTVGHAGRQKWILKAKGDDQEGVEEAA